MLNDLEPLIPEEMNKPEHYKPGKDIPLQVQRWCIVRKYGNDSNNQYVKIEIANANDNFLESLPKNVEGFFIDCRKEELNWWEEEVETIQMRLLEFQNKLIEYQAFPKKTLENGLIIDEGMVFVNILETRIIHFTYQARKMSEAIYNELLGKSNTEETSEAK